MHRSKRIYSVFNSIYMPSSIFFKTGGKNPYLTVIYEDFVRRIREEKMIDGIKKCTEKCAYVHRFLCITLKV